MLGIGLLVMSPWAFTGGMAAAEPTEEGGGKAGSGAPIRVDQLLRLPRSFEVKVADPRLAGATRKDWRERFVAARAALEKAQRELDEVRDEIEQTAESTGGWKMLPPGADMSAADSPLSYRLTQELRHRREDVKEAEHQLTELDVEANLAAVPQDWRE